MKIIFLSEDQLDEGIESGRFNQIVDCECEQDLHGQRFEKLNIALEELLYERYDETKYDEDLVFVSDNVWRACSLGIDVSINIVDTALVRLLFGFLLGNCSEFSIECGVYNPGLRSKNSEYCGRMILTTNEIIVEKLLRRRLGPEILNSISKMDSNRTGF